MNERISAAKRLLAVVPTARSVWYDDGYYFVLCSAENIDGPYKRLAEVPEESSVVVVQDKTAWADEIKSKGEELACSEQ